MNRRKIFGLIVATSVVSGSLIFSGQAASAAETSGTVTGVTSNLRVRSGASLSASVVGYINNGTNVTIKGLQSGFYVISFNGGDAFVSQEYISTASGAVAAQPSSSSNSGQVVNVSTSLNIRSQGSTSSSIVGSLSNGQTFDIISKSGDWYNIKYGQITGFVNAAYVKAGSASTAPAPVAPAPTSTTTGGSSSSGVVTNVSTNLRVRQSASTGSSVIGYLLNNEGVTITGENGGFYAISYQGSTGYVSKDYVTKSGSAPAQSSSNSNIVNLNTTTTSSGNQQGQVTNVSSSLRVRSGASTSASVIGSLTNGASVTVTGKSGSWYQISYNGGTGFVSADYISVGQASSTTTNIVNTSTSTATSAAKYETILNAMKANLGAPYVWGGSGEYLTTTSLARLKRIFSSAAASGEYSRDESYVNKGYRAFDCSGLMQWGFKQAGITIGRTTWDQIGNGTEVPLNSVKPGDLLFYGTLQHVGMYIGNGQWIEAPNKNADVRISSVPWTRVSRARRILN